jgi:hypothetical protein
MSRAHADRSLLFGILALQMDFMSREQFVAAMHACPTRDAQRFQPG